MEKRYNKKRKRKIIKRILVGFGSLYAKRTYLALGGCWTINRSKGILKHWI